MSAPLLEARAVTKRVVDGGDSVTLLDCVSLEVAAGERVALIGHSGSGKSTLLHILGALDADYHGDVLVNGQSLRGLDDGGRALLRNRTLGFVFQAYNLLGHLSAFDNVVLPARFAPGAVDHARAKEVMARVGLGDKLAQRPETLSGGERQRVAIARALYHRPKLVLCDEPTGNLDRQTAADILGLFELITREGAGLLIATHDAAIAETASRVLTLAKGRLS